MKNAKLDKTGAMNRTMTDSLGDTSASMLSSKQRPLSYAADGSGIENERLRSEKARQKLSTLLVS